MKDLAAIQKHIQRQQYLNPEDCRDPQKNNNCIGQENQLFGIFFIAIALAVALASILSEIAFLNNLPLHYTAVIWIGSFVISFMFLLYNKRNIIWSSLQNRLKNSIKWPIHAKIINGICWAGPFAATALLPSILPYMILAAIGCGNVSTYMLLRRYRDVKNNKNNDRNSPGHGQFIVGLISLIAIPIVFEVQTSMFIVREDIAVMLSRILISFAYAVGGIYAVKIKK
jgi:hypothetical protein